MALTSKQLAQFRELAPTHSYEQIAIILGVGAMSLTWYARRYGITMMNPYKYVILAEVKRKLKPDDVKFVREARGIYSQAELAKRYNVSVATISRAQTGGRGYRNV